MLTGQNGILNRATDAKNANGTAQIDEQVKLAVAEALSNGLVSTGASEKNSVLNIYDLAGNIDEQTLENLDSEYGGSFICRGGNATRFKEEGTNRK